MTGLAVREMTELTVSILQSARYGWQQNFAVALDQRHLQRLARGRRGGWARVHMAGGVEPDTASHSVTTSVMHSLRSHREEEEKLKGGSPVDQTGVSHSKLSQ